MGGGGGGGEREGAGRKKGGSYFMGGNSFKMIISKACRVILSECHGSRPGRLLPEHYYVGPHKSNKILDQLTQKH